MDSGQAKCPVGCGSCAGLTESEGKVQVEEAARLMSPGVEKGQSICRTASSLVQPHVGQQVRVED